MPTNNYYVHGTVPVQGSRLASSPIRSEYDSVTAGFDVLGNGLADVGTVNALVVTPPTALTALFEYLTLKVKVLYATTGPATLTVGSLGTAAIKYPDGTPLITNSLLASQYAFFTWTGTVWQYESPLPAAATGLPTTGGTMSGPFNEANGANIVCAATIDLTSATGNYVHVTGSTGPVTSVLLAAGERTVVFDSTPTLVNSANLVLPTGQNITAQAGDVVKFHYDGGAVVKVTAWLRKDGQSVSAPASSFIISRALFGAF